MIPEQTKKDLYNIVSNLVQRDFRLSNPRKTPLKDKNGKPKYNEYFLSALTREALEMYAMSISKHSTEVDETRVKEYHSEITFNHPELTIAISDT